MSYKAVKCPQDRLSFMNGAVISEANVDLANSYVAVVIPYVDCCQLSFVCAESMF